MFKIKRKYEGPEWSVFKHFLNGYLHREDGPAVERSDGRTEWWINGNECDSSQIMIKIFEMREMK